MNREILFRGLRIDGKEWVYGCLIYSEQQDKYYIGVTELMHPVIPETIGHYTGREDKNGKKIFEGDVIRAWQWILDDEFNPVFDKTKFEIATVIWSHEISGWGIESDNEIIATDILAHLSRIEVIGNIHEGENEITK